MTTASAPDEDPGWVERVRRDLIAWYEQGHRDLPWRRDRDPYRVLVSEMMLVQTTVAAVIPYYRRFLAQFPDARSLATAAEAGVWACAGSRINTAVRGKLKLPPASSITLI